MKASDADRLPFIWKLFAAKGDMLRKWRNLKIGTSHNTDAKVQCMNSVAERCSNKSTSRKTSSCNHDRTTPIFINQDAADGT